jgi:CDP-diacylglycerol---serine O-phosphatidyltransferase
MKPLRAIALLPTMFTLGNLLCGFFAIVVVSRIEKPTSQVEYVPAPRIESLGQFVRSPDATVNLALGGTLILLAMFCDAVDGQMARLTRQTSDFGAQLDSLCDLTSFGIAPAMLLVKMCPQFTSVHSNAIWSIAALFVCCAAMRLARFNVETADEDDHSMFAGLPTPAAAAVIASFAILAYSLRRDVNLENFSSFDLWIQRLLPLFAILIAVLMVSRIPYPHPLTQFLHGNRSFRHLVALVFSLMAIVIVQGYAVPLLCVLFVCGPPVRFFWEVARHRRTNEEPLF